MSEKKFPISQEKLEEIIAKYPTPFHIYDEKAIRQNIRRLFKAFDWAPEFREHFAVKATPNPRLMQILAEEGAGSDCSSLAELMLSEAAGITGEKIMLTSNDTPANEFQKAIELGAVINLDDITHIEYLEKHAGMPKIMSFRYNPGNLIAGNDIIGKPMEEAIAYGKERVQFGKPILKNQALQFKVADMAIKIETARQMVAHALTLMDQGLPCSKESAIAKCYASDIAMEVASEAIQMFGGYGYSREYPVEKLLRDAKIFQIFEGTNEVQRIVVANNTIGKF